MGREKGCKKSGGRKKGVTNASTKKKQELAEKAIADKKTPLEFFAETMADEEQPITVRIDCAKALAPYVHCKMPTKIESDNTHIFPDKIQLELIKPIDS